MANPKSELYFLMTLIAVVCVLVFFIFQPFLYALILAVIFATVFDPVHKRMLSVTRQHEGLAAFLSTITVLLVIVIPVSFISVQIVKEASQVYSSAVDNGGTATLSQGIEGFVRGLNIPYLPTASFDLNQYVKVALNWLIQNLGSIFSNVATILFDTLILLVALYFIFKDGIKIKKTVIVLSPLQDTYDETIFSKLKLAINSVVRGSISMALMHGVSSTIGLTLFGVPHSLLWGSVVVIAALVPGLGTSLVIVPAILFLFFTNHTIAAIGMLTWWIIELNVVDNILGPKLMGRGVRLPSFLILLSIFGGIGLFGPIGFLFGPLVLSLLLTFLEIYGMMRKEPSC